MTRLAVALLVLVARIASADPEADADAAFKRAGQLAVSGDPATVNTAIAAYEQLGSARPITRWTDDAWAEAARLAEFSRDYARARRALEQVLEIGTDDRLVARARAALARIEEEGGPAFDAVRAEHERLASEIYGTDDDPTAALTALGALVEQNPTYPRANAARLALALGWEAEGDRGEAMRWFRAAAEAGRRERGQHARLEYVRALTRAADLAEAETELAALDPTLVDSAGARQAAEKLETAYQRRRLRIGLGIALLVIGIGALALARRDLGSWRALGAKLIRPPIEVWFLLPLALLLSLVALPGNPLIARAVRWIGVAGVVIAWLSGTTLEAARAKAPVSARRALTHGLVVVGCVAAAVYLVVAYVGLLDLLEETWRGGPAMD
ncbi:MAG: hypothetical protein H0T46_10990 [Deltaproteobacteria bacterium]|nr:hypothetical protein [Deltaproteobacteria bacterium]